MRSRPLAAAALAVALCLAWGVGVAHAQQAVVEWVADGDTVKVSLDGQFVMVRLLGLDAAENKHSKALQRRAAEHGRAVDNEAAAGEVATAFARTLLPMHSHICLESDDGKEAWDRYGRRLAYIRLKDGADFGAVMISTGMVRAMRRFDYHRKVGYLHLEDSARRENRGLWAVGGP